MTNRNPIDAIAEKYASPNNQGPLSLLARWYALRASIRIVTRHDRGVRGIATGVLVAFDRHMNLVLKDVEETYTVLKWVERTTASGKQRQGRKQEKRQRRLKQVFIAGNSIVLMNQN